ncbi:MAG: isochorismatase family protein, partial [Rhizobium sp.]
AAAGDAPRVTKQNADAFQDTDLATQLAGTTDLLICGMMTQNCVVVTAMSRAADGYKVRVIGDLCTAPTEAVHGIALNALASKLEVCTAADVWTS